MRYYQDWIHFLYRFSFFCFCSEGLERHSCLILLSDVIVSMCLYVLLQSKTFDILFIIMVAFKPFFKNCRTNIDLKVQHFYGVALTKWCSSETNRIYSQIMIDTISRHKRTNCRWARWYTSTSVIQHLGGGVREMKNSRSLLDIGKVWATWEPISLNQTNPNQPKPNQKTQPNKPTDSTCNEMSRT